MLSGGLGIVTLRDVYSGVELRTFEGHSRSVNSVAFSPDGRHFLSGGGYEIAQWNLTTGRVDGIFAGHEQSVYAIAYSRDGKNLVSGGSDKTLTLWDATTAIPLHTLRGHKEKVVGVAFAPDGETVLSASRDYTVKLWDVGTGTEKQTLRGHTYEVKSAVFSPDGKFVLSGSGDGTAKLWDVTTGHELHSFIGHKGQVEAVAFSPDGRIMVSGSGEIRPFPDWRYGRSNRIIKVWNMDTKQELETLSEIGGEANNIAFSPDGKTLASGNEDHTVSLRDNRTNMTLKGHTGSVRSIGYSPDGSTIASGSDDNTVKLWRVTDGVLLATLVNFSDGRWAVTDPDGRFDVADLEEMPHVHWVMPDDPLTPVPLEAFMKDYYEPRLLARILAGETFKPIRSLASLNRTQPEVRITSVVSDGADPSLVKVTVTATGTTKQYQQGGKPVARPTAVHDLRLFRDGQVVGYADGKLADFKDSAFTRTYTVRLPHTKSGQDVVFSAYAFNDDRVKSETVRSTFKAPAVPAAQALTKGTAYVITVGVNQHENPAWDLGFAANDARAVRQQVSVNLQKTDAFRAVLPITLVSDGAQHQASKAAVHAVLDRLSGKALDAQAQAALQGVQGAEQLQKAQPDDLVLLSFAGHGFADDSGNFYLVTQDTGLDDGKAITAKLKAHSISSEELSLWLRDVDAGDMSMIVDACQSAASVQAEGFKPGPMGSRGLGQLSFDKGMRILAASQSDEFALEDNRLKHGLLTFSLINDGLEAFNADYDPKDRKILIDEWLRYGVKRVPVLADEVKSGTLKVFNRAPERGVVRIDAPGASAKTAKAAQQPALFDFTKRRRAAELAGQ